MKCKQLKKIKPYHKGELKDHESDFIKQHLNVCSDCKKYFFELNVYDQVLSQVKSYKPQLANPSAFRNEILDNIHPRKKWSMYNELTKLLDSIIFILIQPATRYSFITAAILIFGVFIYQQSIIVQKIGSLEKRMESNMKTGDSKSLNRKNVENIFDKRSELKDEDKEFNELLDDYRKLQKKHKVLLKVIKERYPEAYQELLKELDRVEFLVDNITI